MPSINMELVQYSELFMLIAAFIYTGAFMLFAVDMIRSSATIRRVEAELAAENAAERELGGATAASGSAAGTGPVPPAEAPADELVDEEMAYLGTARPFANVAVVLAVLGVAAHAFAVTARGIAANRVPWANMYEFLATGALIVAAVYLLVLTRKDVRFLGTFALGLVVTMMAAATIGFPTPVAHVQPALQSPWIAIHVSLAVLAISLFTLTFAMNVLQLIQHRRELSQAAGETTRRSGWQFLRLVPSATSLENWAYRMNAVGFVFWTLGPLITGAIWAEEAWGRYGVWDVKEVWTFVIWTVSAGYLHARATRGWTGNRAAWLSIIGYGCIIFNYAVVNVYFPGLHSYAGLPESVSAR